MKTEQQWYDAVASELRERFLSPGLWAKCYAECDGDEAKARAMYMRCRAAQLKKENQDQIVAAQELARQNLAREEEERLRRKPELDEQRRQEFQRREKEKREEVEARMARWVQQNSVSSNDQTRTAFANGIPKAYRIIASIGFSVILAIILHQEQEAAQRVSGFLGLLAVTSFGGLCVYYFLGKVFPRSRRHTTKSSNWFSQ